MFGKTCQATRKQGGQCTRTGTWRVWCFTFQGERYEHATWVVTCGHHLTHAGSIVSMDRRAPEHYR